MPAANEPEAAALFGTQMVVHIVRNLVFNGLLDAAGTKTNIDETVARISQQHPHLVPAVQALGAVFREAVDDAESQRPKS